MARQLAELKYSPWPVPLNLLQGLVGCVLMCVSLTCCDLDLDHERDVPQKNLFERKKSLYSTMIIGYFRETLSPEEYKEALLFDRLNSQNEEEDDQ